MFSRTRREEELRRLELEAAEAEAAEDAEVEAAEDDVVKVEEKSDAEFDWALEAIEEDRKILELSHCSGKHFVGDF